MNESLYETAPVGLWRLDLNTHFIHANRTALDILGYSSLDELNQSSDKQLLTEISNKSQENLLISNNLGKDIWVELSAVISPEGFVEGTIKDVTSIQPHIEKVSMIKQNIIKRLNQDEPSLSRSSKIA